MADALVSRDRLWYGDLPHVCIKTGRPADGTVDVRFERVPPWTFLLLFAGIFPFFIALLFVRERIAGTVPVTRQAVERYHALGRQLWFAAALVVIGVAGAIVVGEPSVLVLAAIGVVVAVVIEARRTAAWITGVPVRGTPFVELRRVHPAFTAAVAEEYATSVRPEDRR